jgi:hypothetical protein
MDHSVDTIIPLLIKKAGDKNAFIAEEAEKAIIECCARSSEVRIINAAATLINSKISGVKVKALFTMNLVLDRLKGKYSKFKEMDKLVKCLGKGMSEKAAEV